MPDTIRLRTYGPLDSNTSLAHGGPDTDELDREGAGMTFSVLLRDPVTGEIGTGVASRLLATGALVLPASADQIVGPVAGGDRRGRQSAAMLVVRAGGGYGGTTDRSSIFVWTITQIRCLIEVSPPSSPAFDV